MNKWHVCISPPPSGMCVFHHHQVACVYFTTTKWHVCISPPPSGMYVFQVACVVLYKHQLHRHPSVTVWYYLGFCEYIEVEIVWSTTIVIMLIGRAAIAVTPCFMEHPSPVLSTTDLGVPIS